MAAGNIVNKEGPRRVELLDNLRAKLRALFPSGAPARRKKLSSAVLKNFLLLVALAPTAFGVHDSDLHCKHFFYGNPTGTPVTNDLIIRDIYALSSNDTTKFADWVAYRLDAATVTGDISTSRNWKADPWLDEEETLEPDDYTNAYATLHTDRGHQAPLGSFKGTDNWRDTNYLSNITPQASDLNQGLWVDLENSVRDLIGAGEVVYVMTGPIYERGMDGLPDCDEPHVVPSGYWKIVAIQPTSNTNSIRVAAFIFDQDTARDADVIDHLVTIDEVEERSRLNFFCELPDDAEDRVEGELFDEWATEHFE